MKKFFFMLLNIISRIIPYKRGQVVLLKKGNSGSNINPLVEVLEKNENLYKQVIVLNEDEISSSQNKILKLKRYWIVFRSEVVITTHGFPRLRYNNIYVNLWHGVPLKGMGLMNESPDHPEHDDDIFISTSPFYNTLINACFGLDKSIYHITGYPRNDLLYKSNGREILNHLLANNDSERLILYTPTFRDDKNDLDLISSFSDKELTKLDKYCCDNFIKIVVKLHPFNTNGVERLNGYDCFFILEDEFLKSEDIDLYEILNSFDLLITDYSSIYIDFLLIDRPIIFTSHDLKEYQKKRGMLLYPYEYWTPGLKAINLDSLVKAIENSFLEDPYKAKRKELRDIFHTFQDASSTERVLKQINKIMKEGN